MEKKFRDLFWRNKMKKKIIIILVIFVLLISSGLIFRSDIFNFFQNINKGFTDFQKSDIGNIISKVGKEVFTPPPLIITSKESTAVLTKQGIIDETNLQRTTQGVDLLPLFENQRLNEAAMVKANDMFKNQYFEHVSPDGIGPADLVKNSGYDYIVTGENLILGNFKDEKELVQAWMDSPGHRANILNNRYTEIGVAIKKGTYQGESVWIGVQEFGLPMASCPEPSTNLKAQIEDNKVKLDSMLQEIDAYRAEIDRMNPHNPAYNGTVEKYNQLVSVYSPLASESKTLVEQYNIQVSNFNNCVAGVK